MAKITFILGLCGSGKTKLIEKMKAQDPNLYAIDEGFNPYANPDFMDKYLKVKENISKNHDCAIVEIEICREPLRRIVEGLIREIPNAEIKYKCFKNDLGKANFNLSKPGERTPEGRKGINYIISPQYTIPLNSEILDIMN